MFVLSEIPEPARSLFARSIEQSSRPLVPGEAESHGCASMRDWEDVLDEMPSLRLAPVNLHSSHAPQRRISRCRHKQNYTLATIFPPACNMPVRPLTLWPVVG